MSFIGHENNKKCKRKKAKPTVVRVTKNDVKCSLLHLPGDRSEVGEVSGFKPWIEPVSVNRSTSLVHCFAEVICHIVFGVELLFLNYGITAITKKS